MLKVFSQFLDEDTAAGKSPAGRSFSILDSGCGAGIIGICAAAALSDHPGLSIRCQDRDELARLVTLHNAAKNRIPLQVLAAFTEPLLAGPDGVHYDVILSNIPAKAGLPVLEDFVSRSAGLLNPGGRVIIVVVNTLAGFFRDNIKATGACLVREEKGTGHTVFVYGGTANSPQKGMAVNAGPGFLKRYPFYLRSETVYETEDTSLHLKTVYGAPGFDSPGGAVSAAVKLVHRLGPEQFPPAVCEGKAPLLVHEPGQGFFPCLLIDFLRWYCGFKNIQPPLLSGRNILALEAARHNIENNNFGVALTVPAEDLYFGREALLEAAGADTAGGRRRFGFLAAFPELLPQSAFPKSDRGLRETDQLAALWDSLLPLLVEGGLFIVAFGSSEAERFDRKKPAGFTRLGGIKREGFRALAYRYGN